ncbi:MAG TPA: GNAT family N-acetyltransferase [Acidimicrobiia bacterium]|nr:GNAT family N-acetyltransferase [Acidimicrobiia bacterium]
MFPRLELVTGPTPGQVLRPAVPDDAPRLVAMFERCSPASRYSRFLAPVAHFPASHLVDVVRSSPVRRSWVVEDLTTSDVVAVASWFRNPEACGPDGAEVGLLVEDAWQRHGHGAALLDTLAESARTASITTFVAHTLADSRHVHRLLRHLGATTIDCAGHICTLHVSLDPAAEALAG